MEIIYIALLHIAQSTHYYLERARFISTPHVNLSQLSRNNNCNVNNNNIHRNRTARLSVGRSGTSNLTISSLFGFRYPNSTG